MNEPSVTMVGNLTADPELRYTQTGTPVCNFTVACTPRFKRGDQWEDGETLFMRASVWRELGEHVAESLSRGDRVMVTGRLRQRSFEVGGEQRTVMELDADEVGASLRYADVKVRRASRTGARNEGARREAESIPHDDEPPF